MGGSRILVVDDEKNILGLLELELGYEGYKVDTALDGREAIKKAQENIYDLILLDIMLPGISGIEVCRKIRKFSDVPIIMLSARDDINSRVMGLDTGADDYLIKPFLIEELLARVRVCFRRKAKERLKLQPESQSQSQYLIADTLRVNTLTHEVSRSDKTIELTKKEYDLLVYLLQNKFIVLSREQILEIVWVRIYMMVRCNHYLASLLD